MSVATQGLKVTERVVNKKRHTVGYIINGAEITRKNAVQLAKRGWLSNAKLAKNNGGIHLVGEGMKLYELPIRVS